MANHTRYEAFWIPGLLSDVDQDDALEYGLDWLDGAANRNGVVVLNAKLMVNDHDQLVVAAKRHAVVSPQSSRDVRGGQRPRVVLAVWPDNKTLEVAERLALNGELCVIPGSLDDCSHWIERTQAVNIYNDTAVEPAPALRPEISKELDFTIQNGKHKNFAGGYEKEHAIKALRRIHAMPDAPDPAVIERYALTSGCQARGATRLREWYEGIGQNRQYKNHARRPI
jgi:hypothetical protein